MKDIFVDSDTVYRDVHANVKDVSLCFEFGQDRIRTCVDSRRRVYSPLHLTALPPAQLSCFFIQDQVEILRLSIPEREHQT